MHNSGLPICSSTFAQRPGPVSMTDPTGFSLGMSVNPASTFKPLPDRVAFDLCQAYPVPGGNLLLHNTRNGKRAMVKPEVYAISDASVASSRPSTSMLRPSSNSTRACRASRLICVRCFRACSTAASCCLQKAPAKGSSLKLKTGLKNNETGEPVVAILTWERPAGAGTACSSPSPPIVILKNFIVCMS